MVYSGVKNYISDAHRSGMSNSEIMKELTRAGWHVNDVLGILVDMLPKAEKESIIFVKDLSKSYGKLKALDNVTLEVKGSRVTALLGPNGAGKTTLVRILATLSKPTSGKAEVAGLDVVKDAQKLRSIIGLAGQYAAVDEILTGKENLEMFGRLYHLNPLEAKSRAKELLAKFDLLDAANQPVKNYSGGMRRRLDLAASLIIKPKVLFLDEPTAGLDPPSRFILWGIIRELVDQGTTVLLTTQYLEEADQLAHHIFVIDQGVIIAKGTADELKKRVGGDVLELRMVNNDDCQKAAKIIRRFGSQEPHCDMSTGVLTMPTKGGAVAIIDVVRELDNAHVKVQDILLRRPSLEDVFMKLTGHSAQSNV